MHKIFKATWLISLYGMIFFVHHWINLDILGNKNEHPTPVFHLHCQWLDHQFMHHSFSNWICFISDYVNYVEEVEKQEK